MIVFELEKFFFKIFSHFHLLILISLPNIIQVVLYHL